MSCARISLRVLGRAGDRRDRFCRCCCCCSGGVGDLFDLLGEEGRGVVEMVGLMERLLFQIEYWKEMRIQIQRWKEMRIQVQRQMQMQMQKLMR